MKSLGTKAIKVTFSEPVEKATSGNFQVDGKSFYGSATQESREIILTPYDSATLSVGEHTLTVAGVEDYFGLKALSSDSKFTVVEDKTAPTVTNVEATLEKVTVTFSEEVDPATVTKTNVYWKSGDTKMTAVGMKKIAADKYEFDFTGKALPGYETTLFVEGVKDYSGNVITETQVKVTATVDQTRPEVASVKVDSLIPTKVTVKFTKAVSAADVKYYTITDADGKSVGIRTVTAAPGDTTGQVFEITTYTALTNTNTIKISGVRDLTTLQNTMLDFTTTISLDDKTAPEYSSTSASTSRNIVIAFNEAMDPATLANPANYLITVNGTARQLPEGTELTPVQSGKAVLVKLPQYYGTTELTIPTTFGGAGSVTAIQVMGVKDVAGNTLKDYFKLITLVAAPAGLSVYDTDIHPTANAAYTANGEVKVRFNQPIGKAVADDFTINGANIDSVDTDGTDVVTLHVSGTALNSTTPNFTLAIAANNGIETVTGNEATNALTTITVADAVKPEIKLASGAYLPTVAASNKIIVPFSETLDTANDANYKYDLVVTKLSDGSVVPVTAYNTQVGDATGAAHTAPNNAVIITLINPTASAEYSVAIKDGADFIQDLNNNVAAKSSTFYTGLNGISPAPAAPTVNAVADNETTVTGTAEAGSTVTVKDAGGTTLGSTTANAATGAFSVTITAQTAGSVLSVTATNAAGNVSSVATVTVSDNTAPTAPTLTAQNVKGGDVVTIPAAGTGNTAWLAPAGTTTFVEGPTMTKAANDAVTTIAAPTNEGTYYLYLVDAAGNASTASTGTVVVDNTAPSVATKLSAPGALTTSESLVFSEALDSASRSAVKTAVDAAYVAAPGTGTATVSSAWDTDNKTLNVTITVTGDGVVNSSAIAPIAVTDLAGNTSAALAVQN